MAKKKTTTRNRQGRGKQMNGTQKRSTEMHRTQKSDAQKHSAQRRSASRKNNALLWAGGALLVAVLAMSAILLGNRQNSLAAEALPAEISVDQAYQKYLDGAFVLDVRTPEEWDDYHAPGTILIPLDELPARLNEVPQDEEVVVICRSGNRSQEGRDILLNAGYEQVTSVSGGLNAWGAAGYRLEGENP